LLLGCTPKGRFTEQHDVFFGIARTMSELKPAIKEYWKEAPKIHIDAWREVKVVDGYRIRIEEKSGNNAVKENKLFFLNLGGYKPNEFEEFHYKMLAVAPDTSQAIRASKQTAFYKHVGFKGANSHIDEKYGIDVDDILNIGDILSNQYKDLYTLTITKEDNPEEDIIHLGYLTWEKIV
jgi:hypothetical protein